MQVYLFALILAFLQVPFSKEVNHMDNNKEPVVNITVNITGVQETTQLVELLCEK